MLVGVDPTCRNQDGIIIRPTNGFYSSVVTPQIPDQLARVGVVDQDDVSVHEGKHVATIAEKNISTAPHRKFSMKL